MRRILTQSFSLLNIDFVKLTDKWNYSNVISPYYRIYLIEEGEGFISNFNRTLKLTPGHLYIIPSFTLCNLYCTRYMSVYFVHFFEDSHEGVSLFEHDRSLLKVQATDIDKTGFERMLAINPGRGINRSDDPKIYEKNSFYHEYEELNNTQSLATFFETQGILLQLIARFLESRNSGNIHSTTIPSKILDTIRYIHLHLKDQLSVASLARRANQDQDYFSRTFLKYMGTRPLHYLHEKRIERAQYLIAMTDSTFEQIAFATGFASIPHFFKIFKRTTGLTPDQYRKRSFFSTFPS